MLVDTSGAYLAAGNATEWHIHKAGSVAWHRRSACSTTCATSHRRKDVVMEAQKPQSENRRAAPHLRFEVSAVVVGALAGAGLGGIVAGPAGAGAGAIIGAAMGASTGWALEMHGKEDD